MALQDLTQDQRDLADFISEISERCYRAGWMQGIEYEVWEAMHAPDLGSGALRLTVEDAQQLHAMSTNCRGWIVFDDVNEESFIPIEAWRGRQTV